MNQGPTLRTLKAEATRREYRRVYGNFGMPPRDIVVETKRLGLDTISFEKDR
jgi:hypothetical protein